MRVYGPNKSLEAVRRAQRQKARLYPPKPGMTDFAWSSRPHSAYSDPTSHIRVGDDAECEKRERERTQGHPR